MTRNTDYDVAVLVSEWKWWDINYIVIGFLIYNHQGQMKDDGALKTTYDDKKHIPKLVIFLCQPYTHGTCFCYCCSCCCCCLFVLREEKLAEELLCRLVTFRTGRSSALQFYYNFVSSGCFFYIILYLLCTFLSFFFSFLSFFLSFPERCCNWGNEICYHANPLSFNEEWGGGFPSVIF